MFRLTYISTATSVMTSQEIQLILDRSRRNNEQIQVTGLLLFDGKRFLQALRRFMRLVEDWALASDSDLAATLAAAKASAQVAKAATVKLEIVRRALSPAAWLDYLAGAI